ncbi:VOC family protein [Pseudokineococcus sp. 1T1Z-3]|uniref:VOC family protein n=1 Tax=Pseudokineococcus sp. 1T1Z-3 TaxID=3132745 RepID=UPI003096AF82
MTVARVLRTYPAGVPCWVDLEVEDTGAAQDVYGRLLGWSFTEAMPPGAPGSYLVATLDGQDVAAVGSPDMGRAPAWSTYVAVDDADATARAVVEAGGAVTAGPADAGPGGRAVACSDPQGVPFRLWQARRRLGAQLVNVPGAWNFSDLVTADVDAALAFYRPLFGWRAAPLWEGGDPMLSVPGYGDHLAATVYPDIHEQQSFAPEDFADVVGGVVPAGTNGDDHARWRVTVGVADRDEAVTTAERLGFLVLRTAERTFARTADLRDPFGAELSLSQFTPPTG